MVRKSLVVICLIFSFLCICSCTYTQNRIKNATEPLSIAVGTAHLFGENGLLEAFKLNRLKITKISSRDLTKDFS